MAYLIWFGVNCWLPSPALSDQHSRASKDSSSCQTSGSRLERQHQTTTAAWTELAKVIEPNSSQEQQAASQEGRGHTGSLGGSGWALGRRCALRMWHSSTTGGHRGREISILEGLQGSATPSRGWSSIEDNLGDNSEGSSLLHPKDSRLSFFSVTCLEETWHPQLLCTCVLREEPGLKCHLIRADR